MFGHLQVYSSYSFQNSTILIDDLCRLASDKNIDALALTDKNVMYGIVEFYHACKKYNIKPILGMEASVCIDGEVYSLLLLARNDTGYLDLVRISSHICTNGNHSIELDVLKMYSEHLYVIDGIEFSPLCSIMDRKLYDLAAKHIKDFKSIFGSYYIISLQNHDLAYQLNSNVEIVEIAKQCDVKICFSNEVRYLFKEEAKTLELLKASQTQEVLDVSFQPLTDNKYLKDYLDISLLFDNEIIQNTSEIIKDCNASITFGQMHLPKYLISGGVSSCDYLRDLCSLGLSKRLNNNISIEYQERLDNELSVIIKMGFADYFLIVFDYVRFAKKNNISVGPGRGSATGSLVSYALGITNIDPIAYNLLFERFLNIDRISMPDIDIDFQDDRRDEVVQYVINKYGQEHVAQIVTFSTYGPKVAIKDLGKSLGIPLHKLEKLTKLMIVDQNHKPSISYSYENSYGFQSDVNNDSNLSLLLQHAMLVEKLPKNISTHAAGVVLSGDSLNSVLPLTKGPRSGMVTQYSQNYIESIGLLKMDFLGLKNLSIIQNVCKDIELQFGKPFNINQINLNDSSTFRLLASGDTYGVFQLESKGMTDLLIKMKCSNLDDIIATIALYRPGPMKNIPIYLDRKNGIEKIEYPISNIKPILENTYGVMIYQEQIMQVAQVIAGFSLATADILRAAISKKDVSKMNELKDQFIAGGVKNGYEETKVTEVFDLIYKFASYGFNKAHSVAYGYIAYQLAYLKANYPLSFYSALLTNEQGSEVAKEKCVQLCKKNGISILPPSINYSTDKFIREDNSIRFSLLSIKQVGVAGFRAIVEEREKGLFKDIFDFVARIEDSKLNKAMIESLIDAGAFDEFGYSRATLKLNYDKIENHRELISLGIDERPILEDKNENNLVKIELEKNALGVYLTKHPIEIVKDSCSGNFIGLSNLMDYINQKISCIVFVSRVNEYVDKKGQDMCFITLYDEGAFVDGVIFSSVYKDIKHILNKDRAYIVTGDVQYRDKLSFIIGNIEEIK